MTRTERKPALRRQPARHRGNMLVGIFIGLVLGVLISAAVTWYVNGMGFPGRSGENGPRPAELPPGADPAELPGKPGDKPPARPVDLPVVAPDAAPAPAEPTPPAEVPPAAAAEPSEKLQLQAGAFVALEEADNLRARLALIGLESSIQKVELPGKGMLYRVRVGPFANPEELKNARAEMSRNGIDATVVKP